MSLQQLPPPDPTSAASGGHPIPASAVSPPQPKMDQSTASPAASTLPGPRASALTSPHFSRETIPPGTSVVADTAGADPMLGLAAGTTPASVGNEADLGNAKPSARLSGTPGSSGAANEAAAQAQSPGMGVQQSDLAPGTSPEASGLSAGSASWPMSSEAPVKTFVPEASPRSARIPSPSTLKTYGPALAHFMAEQSIDQQNLPLITHGDALVDASGPPPAAGEDALQAPHEGWGSTAEHKQSGDSSPNASLDTQAVLVPSAAEQMNNVLSGPNKDGVAGSHQLEAHPVPAEQVPLLPAKAAADGQRGMQLSSDYTGQPGQMPASSCLGHAEQQPEPAVHEAVQLLHNAESSTGLRSMEDRRPTWTRLPPNPPGETAGPILMVTIGFVCRRRNDLLEASFKACKEVWRAHRFHAANVR